MKKLLLITCTSFTITQLLFAVFAASDFAPAVNSQSTLQAFIMSLSIAIFMVAAEKAADYFAVVPLWLDGLIRLMICYMVVFIEGTFFGMITFSWLGLWQITPLLLVIFLLTYFISYLTCSEWAEAINKCIREHH